jgi:hypothetical protein
MSRDNFWFARAVLRAEANGAVAIGALVHALEQT